MYLINLIVHSCSVQKMEITVFAFIKDTLTSIIKYWTISNNPTYKEMFPIQDQNNKTEKVVHCTNLAVHENKTALVKLPMVLNRQGFIFIQEHILPHSWPHRKLYNVFFLISTPYLIATRATHIHPRADMGRGLI